MNQITFLKDKQQCHSSDVGSSQLFKIEDDNFFFFQFFLCLFHFDVCDRVRLENVEDWKGATLGRKKREWKAANGADHREDNNKFMKLEQAVTGRPVVCIISILIFVRMPEMRTM